MELYDYPGGYAKRFDGIGSGGEDDSGQLAKIQPEALHVADIRMRQEVVPAI
jgi:type VI secretion system secreted protein VgrG